MIQPARPPTHHCAASHNPEGCRQDDDELTSSRYSIDVLRYGAKRSQAPQWAAHPYTAIMDHQAAGWVMHDEGFLAGWLGTLPLCAAVPVPTVCFPPVSGGGRNRSHAGCLFQTDCREELGVHWLAGPLVDILPLPYCVEVPLSFFSKRHPCLELNAENTVPGPRPPHLHSARSVGDIITIGGRRLKGKRDRYHVII
jgi:hypothetical protein